MGVLCNLIDEVTQWKLEALLVGRAILGRLVGQRCTPTPYTLSLYSAPHTLHPTPYTLHSTPYTLYPFPILYTPHPTPYTLHPTPNTLHPTETSCCAPQPGVLS